MTTERQSRVNLGRSQWFILATSLCIIIFVFYSVVYAHDAYRIYDCEHRYLPSIEARFGFKGGRVALAGSDRAEYALVDVNPLGQLGRAHFRSGDVPISRDGGLADFCGAMRYVEGGDEQRVTVINRFDSDTRVLRIPPLPQSGKGPR